MRRTRTAISLAVCGLLALAAGSASAQSTYTWAGPDGSWSTPASWSPARNTPHVGDTLIFNAGSPTVTGLPATETIGSLQITGNAAVTFDGAGTGATLTINGGANALQIAAGSSLRLFGGGGASGSLVVDVSSGSTATIAGDVIFHSTAANTAHRLNANQANQIVFASGSTAALAAVSTGAGGGFGSGTQGFPDGVIFQSGSAYYQGGLKDGTRNGGTGSNPFARTAPATNVVFQSGASYVNLGGLPASVGRTYANFIWRDGYGATRNFGGTSAAVTFLNDIQILAPGGTMADASTPAPGSINSTQANFTINGNVLIEAGGAQFQDNLAHTAASVMDFKGNLTIQNASRFRTVTTANGLANRTYKFSGSSNQVIDVNGTVLHRVEIDNPAGVTLASPLGVTGALTVTSGSIAVTGKGGLALGTGVSVPAGYTGPVGSATSFNAASTGPVVTDSGVELNITTAGTGTAQLAVLPLTGAATGLPNSEIGAARTWVIEVSHAGSALVADLTIPYTTGDIAGIDESQLKLARFDGANWVDVPATVNTTNKTVTATGVSAFSEWSVYGPAASAAVPDWHTFR
jgi:hypothetical protein